MSLTYTQAVEQTITAGEQIHQIVNGTATTEVTVEDGSKIPSVRKALLDNFYFKDPIAWQAGQTETIFNQLRQFTDGSWWYAPSATASNPISMGATPVGDSLWKIYDFDAIGKLTPQIREALRRSYAESGYNMVGGSFELGGTLTSPADVILSVSTGIAYTGTGPFPQVVDAGTNPTLGGFISQYLAALRTQLADGDGYNLVGGGTYTFIRSYTGNATKLQCIGRSNIFDGGYGIFAVDLSDTTSLDNDGTTLIDGLGRRWKRIVTDGRYSVKWFGAKGDTVADDATPTQAAVDYVGSIGGGVVFMPKTPGWYRWGSGVKLPSYVTLEGPNADRFPFNSGAAESSCIEADFSDPMQWVIEPDTRKTSGARFAHNEIITQSTPFNFTYNCQAKNIFIKSSGDMPYGGVRMHGCPGYIIDNVSVLGTGAGALINFSFGGSCKIHTLANYYGVVLWSNANANDCEIYATKLIETSQLVPAEYRMPFMAALEGATLVNDYKLHTNDHATRAFGLIIGALGGETSSGNTISYTGEKFSGGSFHFFGYGTTFTKYYVEGATGEMVYGMVGAHARLSVTSMHCYLDDPSGVVFDMGIAVQSNMNLTGLLSAPGGYGYGPYNDFSSTVVFDRFFGDGWPMNRRVTYTSGSSEKPATLINSWVNTGGLKRPAGYIWRATDHTVSLYGEITGGAAGTVAFILPVGYRPLYACDFVVIGGSVRVLASGEVLVLSGTTVDLGQVNFDSYN